MIQIGKVKYNLGFNLYDAKTKITKYNNETGLFGKDKNDKDTYRVGMELGEIWGMLPTACILLMILMPMAS